MRGNEFAQLSDYYRAVWSGFLVAPESGTYLLGIRGPNGELTFDGKVLVQQRNKPWGTRSELVPVKLQKGQRYPIRVTSDAKLLSGIELLWQPISLQSTAVCQDRRRALGIFDHGWRYGADFSVVVA